MVTEKHLSKSPLWLFNTRPWQIHPCRHYILHAWWFSPCSTTILTLFNSWQWTFARKQLNLARNSRGQSLKKELTFGCNHWLPFYSLQPLFQCMQRWNMKPAITSFVTVLSVSNSNICSLSFELSKFYRFWQNIIKLCISSRLIMK